MYYGTEMLQNECRRHDNREKILSSSSSLSSFYLNESPPVFVAFCENFNKFYVPQL